MVFKKLSFMCLRLLEGLDDCIRYTNFDFGYGVEPVI